MNIQGPHDLYSAMSKIKGDECVRVTGKMLKDAKIKMDFVVKSAEALGLKIKTTGGGTYIHK